jgi:hypothetical protein
MQNYVPHWLPDGMGLVDAFGSGWGAKGGAHFADARCREIELWFWESSDVGSGQHVGAWVVQQSKPKACGNAVLGEAMCLEYRGRVADGAIGVQMMGLSRPDGDRIVRSIPLTPGFPRSINPAEHGSIVRLQIVPVPEGPQALPFERRPTSKAAKRLSLVARYIPDPLPTPCIRARRVTSGAI